MCHLCSTENNGILRRDFIKTMGVSVAGMSFLNAGEFIGSGAPAAARKMAKIRCAFLYPPTKVLDEEGYYSWPGYDFDAEGRQKQYTMRLKEIEKNLGIHINFEIKPLDTASDVDKFISGLKETNPDGLLLFPFKKSPPYEHITRIIEEVKIPAIIMSSLGILLIEHIKQLNDRTGVYMINSLDDLGAVEQGLKMIKTRSWLRDAKIVNIGGKDNLESKIPLIGTTVKNIPHQRFFDYFASTRVNSDVEALAKKYMSEAVKIYQPTKDEIIDAAKNYFIFKKILEEEKADALMMDCLPGLRKPHKHVPPCMGFMSLRDEGIAMGCQSDLDATITMMLLQDLFGKPGFMHNASYNTEKDCYFCAHCTSPSKMNGIEKPSEPFELMSHCESGWGAVPRVLFKKGQPVTITKYLFNEKKPQLLLYSGEILDCPPMPQTGGCRTNVETTINELEKGIEIKGQHLIMVYGNYVKQLKQFCKLYDIGVVV